MDVSFRHCKRNGNCSLFSRLRKNLSTAISLFINCPEENDPRVSASEKSCNFIKRKNSSTTCVHNNRNFWEKKNCMNERNIKSNISMNDVVNVYKFQINRNLTMSLTLFSMCSGLKKHI